MADDCLFETPTANQPADSKMEDIPQDPAKEVVVWHMKCMSGDLRIAEPLSDSSAKTPDSSAQPIESFADVPVVVEAHFEERMMDLREVLAITPGTVIPLNTPAGETLRVYVGNVFLASAEVIVIEDRLALRITEFEARP
jgi:flagellar motor switch protein FliN/FliY